MLTSIQNILEIAEERKCAIPAFNVYNIETLMGVSDAAEESGAPVIIQMYSRLFDSNLGKLLSASILKAIEGLHVPAAFHLDHGAGINEVMRAIRYGATGVMIDASTMPIENNIKTTHNIVELAKANEIGVEGELGHVGTTSEDFSEDFTDVDEAERFVLETGVSALAIMVGTAHGRYKKAPVLGINRIKEIKEAVKIPLVLHGGSGIPDDQIKGAIEAGIRKVNFGTDVCYSFLDSVFLTEHNGRAVDMFMKDPIASVKTYALNRINVLGANTK